MKLKTTKTKAQIKFEFSLKKALLNKKDIDKLTDKQLAKSLGVSERIIRGIMYDNIDKKLESMIELLTWSGLKLIKL